MSTSNRILGIVSGFDTETLVNDLMEVENLRLENIEKEKQYTEWEQEAYQDVVSMLTDFQSNYFDLLNSDTNITSETFFSEFNYSVTSNNVSTSVVEVSANGDIISGTHTIDSIAQLATYDTWTGNDVYLDGITSSGFDYASLAANLGGDDLTFSLSIGSETKTVTIANADLPFADEDAFVTAFNTAISDVFGSDFNSIVSLTETGELDFSLAANELTILEGDSANSMTALGITSGQSSSDYEDKTIADLFGFTDADVASLEINGVSISLLSTDTLDEALTKINDADAGVKVTFDSLNDKIVMKATEQGTANIIEIEDGSATENFFMKLFSEETDLVSGTDVVLSGYSVGQNAKLTLDGAAVVMSSNTFSYEGVTYTLKGTTTDPIDISVEANTEEIVDKIKAFVSDYNDIIEHINTKLNEKKYYDYEPLTDDEKEAMTDDEIELWEEKSQSGILRGSSELSSMLMKFRNAVIDRVSGGSLTLKDIGIGTTSYADYGKLSIDEDTLTDAIENNFSEVVNLFTQESDYKYMDSANASTRYSENGIGDRLKDILKDYVRTTRDSNGNKGILIEKVGIENDTSFYNNYFTDQLEAYDTKIDDMMDFLADKEDYYYSLFASMESALSEMESSYSSLLSSMGTSS